MDFGALEDFNLVVAHGGFGRASRAVGRPKATLSRRIAELEQSLGVRLIERGGRSLRLTDEGRTLHERSAGLLAELREAGELVASRAQAPRGPLRVSAPIVLAHAALARVAAKFALDYPEVRLEVVAEDRKTDPVEEGYDLVIRVDPAPDERLAGRLILRDQRWVVSRHAMPAVPGPLPAVVLRKLQADTQWRMRDARDTAHILQPQTLLTFSSLLMVREAVLAGTGAALLPRLLVAEDVREGRLACWGVEDGSGVEIWALYSSRRLLSARVRAFLDAVIAAFPERSYAEA